MRSKRTFEEPNLGNMKCGCMRYDIEEIFSSFLVDGISIHFEKHSQNNLLTMSKNPNYNSTNRSKHYLKLLEN